MGAFESNNPYKTSASFLPSSHNFTDASHLFKLGDGIKAGHLLLRGWRPVLCHSSRRGAGSGCIAGGRRSRYAAVKNNDLTANYVEAEDYVPR